MSDKEDLEREWYGTLPDAERAEVLKSLISERGQTRRAEIAAEEKMHSARVGNDGYYVVRVIFIALVAVALLCATCVGYYRVTLYAPQPPPAVPVSQAPTSVPSAPAAK